ncbi:hypothetical protein [Pantoea sp. 1.19]|uniref:hypothetical protein n=1 Tax=Pantoea sp. 1.19 TaxID=1925589 RepID=UPI0009490D27|nr:hypothetical protein [Pantoea sp. 1.19]
MWARAGGRDRPTHALLHATLAAPLAAFLARNERRVLAFFSQCGGLAVEFDTPAAFANINTPAALLDSGEGR